MQKVSTQIYQQAAQQQAAQQQQAAGGAQQPGSDESWSGHPEDDKTINADYKVKKDEDKKTRKINFFLFILL